MRGSGPEEGRAQDRPTSRLDFVRFLGVRIDRVRASDLMDYVAAAALDKRRVTVLYVNVHCMNVQARDAAYAAILERTDLVYCDGTGVRLAARLVGRDIPERLTGADWIDDLCRRAVRDDLSLFLLGSVAGSAHDAGAALQQRYPGLRIVGTASGYGAGAGVVARINEAKPDVLLVGMGTPRQEKWIDAYRNQLDVPVVWAVGALYDFVSGRIRRGPHWLTDHGLEWLCRLAVEPRKLWRRYLIGNPQFIWRVVRAYWLS